MKIIRLNQILLFWTFISYFNKCILALENQSSDKKAEKSDEQQQKQMNSTSFENNNSKNDVDFALDEKQQKLEKMLNKCLKEKQALEIINELIYKDEKPNNNPFLLDILLSKNFKRAFKLAIEYLYDISQPAVLEMVGKFQVQSKNDITFLQTKIAVKKKDIIRISPTFEWSQDDNEIKMRIRFAKNLETPGEKNVSNFKVNCTRSQLEVQAFKEHDDYVVHYYRRLNLYEFIRPYSCKSYKESEGTFILHFLKNQATLFWNFLNQPSEDHYNTHAWWDVHAKYDEKVGYVDFREHAMENLLISDIEGYVKENLPAKKRRLKRIKKAKNLMFSKNYEEKNYCLSIPQEKNCNLPKVTDWGYWLM